MCECGAYKTFGAAKGEVGHSNWCVWSPNYVPPEATPESMPEFLLKCDSYLSGIPCSNYATTWVTFASYSTKWYYCDDCFKSTQATMPLHSYGTI